MRPVGDVTMLFTDVEGSTRLARVAGARWPDVLGEHDRLVEAAIVAAGGCIERIDGDSFFATFADARAAADAAAAAQRALRAHSWPAAVGEVRVRMGLHTGTLERRDGVPFGIEIHRAARIAAASHGGQVLMSQVTRARLGDGADCDDLGLHRLKDFPSPGRLFHLRVDERGARDFPEPRTLDVRPTNLPPAVGRLVGRDGERDEVVATLGEQRARLVTLIGLGGVGKTRLALAIASALVEHHPGGVWLVEADRLADASELLPALASALRLRDAPGVDLLSMMVERFDRAPVVFVLDNLEHLPGAPGVVEELLATVPSARVLATSRVPLRAAGERVVALEPLGAEHARELFASLARDADPRVQLDDDAVAGVCRRVDGLPLALELAAAQLRVLTPPQLAARLESVLALRGGEDRPARQRSLRATLEWSLGGLGAGPRRLFDRLAVFSGPMPLEIIEAVCRDEGDVVVDAAALLDHSLLRRTERGLGLPAALHQLAGERLDASGEREALQLAHAGVIADLGLGGKPTWIMSRAERALAQAAEPETWSAVAWARQRDPALHGRLVAAWAATWVMSAGRLRDAIDETRAAVATARRGSAARGELLLCHAYLLLFVEQVDEAVALADEAMPLLADRTTLQRSRDLLRLGVVQLMAGRKKEAIAIERESLAHARELGDPAQVAHVGLMLAQDLLLCGDVDAAGSLLDEVETLVAGLDIELAGVLPNLRADWALIRHEPGSALAGFAIALDASLQLGTGGQALWDAAGVVVALDALGHTAATLESGALLELDAADQATSLRALRGGGDDLLQVIERSRTTAGEATTERTLATTRAVPPGRRLSRVLELARRPVAPVADPERETTGA
jgi:predicted ATPase/class 3 adenylate cyclase